MNIVLIGYRGTGKGAIGPALAKRINRPFVDTDDLVEERAGMQIPEIFEKAGEKHFRSLESEVIKEVCAKDNYVIATGGGAPMRQENAEAIKKNSIVVLLTCSPEVIHQRIGGDEHRPALTSLKDEMREIRLMLKKRMPTYKNLADFVTDTSEKEILENVGEIIGFLEEKGLV